MKFEKRRPFLATIFVLAALLLPRTILAKSSSPSSTIIQSSPTTILKQQQSQQQNHVVIYETEVLEDDEWKGAMPSRWTTSVDNMQSPPPIHVQPPPSFQWQGDWKICMSPQTNELGWQVIGKTQRRRMWLRSIQPDTAAVSTTTITRKRRLSLYSIFSAIRDDWNFKGFGLSFYKSLIFLSSFGMSFRIPLSQNLDWCERHPLFPSLSGSVGLYYPPTIGLFVSISTNVDYLKWNLEKLQQQFRQVCRKLAVTICKTLLLLVSLPFFILSKQQDSKWQQWLSSIPSTQQSLFIQPYQKVDVSERIGISISWRISRKRGFEFRVSYWHSYLPTILYIHSILKLVENQKMPMEYWLRKRTASWGLSTSGPTPNAPHFSCSTCISLSGFHYSSLRKKKRSIVLNTGNDAKKNIKTNINNKIKRVEMQENDQSNVDTQTSEKEAKASGVKHVAG